MRPLKTEEINSSVLLPYFGKCIIKILGRFECNLGNISLFWKGEKDKIRKLLT